MIPNALLRQTVSIEAYQGETAAGPLFADPVTAPGLLFPKRRWVPAFPAGDVNASDAVLLLRPDVVIAVGDRVTCESVVYRVLAVNVPVGLSQAEFIATTLSRSES